jgi:hypothetical protein
MEKNLSENVSDARCFVFFVAFSAFYLARGGRYAIITSVINPERLLIMELSHVHRFVIPSRQTSRDLIQLI